MRYFCLYYFNPDTKVKYSIPKATYVTIKVYDILGKEIVSLINEEKEPGSYKVSFDSGDLASGIYICRLQAGNYISQIKMLCVK